MESTLGRTIPTKSSGMGEGEAAEAVPTSESDLLVTTPSTNVSLRYCAKSVPSLLGRDWVMDWTVFGKTYSPVPCGAGDRQDNFGDEQVNKLLFLLWIFYPESKNSPIFSFKSSRRRFGICSPNEDSTTLFREPSGLLPGLAALELCPASDSKKDGKAEAGGCSPVSAGMMIEANNPPMIW